MKKSILLCMILIIVLALCGCGENDLKGECECIVKLNTIPKELRMLDENLAKELYVSLYLENIYTEESMNVKLTLEDDFEQMLNLKPGTYKVKSCYAGPSNLLPMEVETKSESIQLTPNDEVILEIAITNMEEVQDWIWHTDADREVLEAGAFSHTVQFEGQIIDLKQITEYVTFESEEQIRPGKKLTIYGGNDKGVSITVINEGTETTSWKKCKLLGVAFHKNNIIWGQGASIGMNVKEAVHAETGLYGKPSSMSGSILAGVGSESTSASWVDTASGDKLTLTMTASGDYIMAIRYEFAVFE